MSLSHHPDIGKAAEILKRGGLVAFPTDTLYGLGAHAFIGKAVERVYKVKGRPYQKPIPLLIGSLDDLALLTDDFPEVAARLARAFWPGALTLVVKSSARVPGRITGGGDTVAVRMPAHPVARELIIQLGAPITGTSANKTGGPDPATATEVRKQLGRLVDLIIDGGACPAGQPSTVVDVTAERPVLLRQGAVPEAQIEEVCGALAQA